MKRISFICLFACICLSSCVTRSNSVLQMSQGNAGELLVIMKDYLWNDACGDSVRQYFTEPVWGLPASEPMFTLFQRDELSSFFQKYRNILIINVDPVYEYANLRVKNDLYAANQVVFNLDAPSADSVISCVYMNKDIISAYFLIKDRDAIIEDYKRSVSKPIVEKLNEKFMVDIIIPKSYKLYDEKDDFVWIAREEGEKNWHILIWEEPYLRTSQLDTDSLIFKMNAMTRRYVPGDRVGSYMADEPSIPPAVKRFEKKGIYSVQLNGLWKMENGFMGGPYVNQTIVDTQRQRLVTGVGFVFYFNRDKRQMVRQLESILYTMTPVIVND